MSWSWVVQNCLRLWFGLSWCFHTLPSPLTPLQTHTHRQREGTKERGSLTWFHLITDKSIFKMCYNKKKKPWSNYIFLKVYDIWHKALISVWNQFFFSFTQFDCFISIISLQNSRQCREPIFCSPPKKSLSPSIDGTLCFVPDTHSQQDKKQNTALHLVHLMYQY